MNSHQLDFKVDAIIQSTWRSNTFENKSLVKLANHKTILETIVDSIRKIKYIQTIFLSTSSMSEDDELVSNAKALGLKVYRGEIDNVLERLYQTSLRTTDTVLKVDGNKPFFDAYEAEKLIEDHFNGQYDYSYNDHYQGVVYGTDCEVFNKAIFTQVDQDELTRSQLESGTLWFRSHPNIFKLNKFPSDENAPGFRVLLENQKDLEVINQYIIHSHSIQNNELIQYLKDNPIIAQYNQRKESNEVSFNKLLLFPEKIKNLQAVDDNTIDFNYPISIELSLTMRCNFHCVWCSDAKIRESTEDKIDLNCIRKLAEDLAMNGCKGVTIEGGGEPTIYREFDAAVNIFKSHGLSLGLITNGSKKLSPEIIKSFDWIRVSLDVSSQEEMTQLKSTIKFERVLSNIFHYAKHCSVVGVGYVATNQNTSELDTLVLRLRESGVKYIQLRPVIDHPELLPEIDLDYLKKYEKEYFSVITSGMKDNVIKGNQQLPCISHSLSSVITADGSVYLCGRLNIYDWIKPIGNINKNSFYDIWNGEERKKQSEMVFDSKFCSKYCPECRLTKYNIGLDQVKQIKTTNFI